MFYKNFLTPDIPYFVTLSLLNNCFTLNFCIENIYFNDKTLNSFHGTNISHFSKTPKLAFCDRIWCKKNVIEFIYGPQLLLASFQVHFLGLIICTHYRYIKVSTWIQRDTEILFINHFRSSMRTHDHAHKYFFQPRAGWNGLLYNVEYNIIYNILYLY